VLKITRIKIYDGQGLSSVVLSYYLALQLNYYIIYIPFLDIDNWMFVDIYPIILNKNKVYAPSLFYWNFMASSSINNR